MAERLDVFLKKELPPFVKCKNCSWRARPGLKQCEKCTEICRKSRKKWRDNNLRFARDLECASTLKRRKALKEAVFIKLGNKCANPACRWLNEDGSMGCKDRRALQIDHVQGGGLKELKKLYEFKYLKTVLADATGKYQLLCANCNWIKRHVRKEVPNGSQHPSWMEEATSGPISGRLLET